MLAPLNCLQISAGPNRHTKSSLKQRKRITKTFRVSFVRSPLAAQPHGDRKAFEKVAAEARPGQEGGAACGPPGAGCGRGSPGTRGRWARWVASRPGWRRWRPRRPSPTATTLPPATLSRAAKQWAPEPRWPRAWRAGRSWRAAGIAVPPSAARFADPVLGVSSPLREGHAPCPRLPTPEVSL